ncbi:MAG: hypothetical protein Tsb0014_29580 [Pleurocapsa sp.]
MSSRRLSIAPLLKSQWTYISLFAILGLLGIVNHSMWRDEMNVWLIAKYSHNFADFWDNVRYDRGHPGLWHLLVSIAFHIADNPLAMQILHWAIGVLAIIIFWLFSPFTHRQKILFSFGYLPFFENLLISRNYGLGMLFLFGICTAFNSRTKTYLGLACLLALLANSNIYGLFIGVALTLTFILDFRFNDESRKTFLHRHFTLLKLHPKIDIFLSSIIVLITFVIAAYMILPPSQVVTEEVLTEIPTESNLELFLISLGRILGGYTLLIPNPDRLLDLVVCGIIALVIFFISLTNFTKKPLPLFFFSFSTLTIFLFSYVSFPGRGPRHFGHFYLILIAALWIASYYPPQSWLENKIKFLRQKQLKKTRLFVFMLLLYINFFCGIFRFGSDLFIPYSASQQVANYLQNNQLQDEFIVGNRDVNMAGVSGYLGQEIYYLERNNFGSFSLFLKQERQELDQEKVLQKLEKLLTTNAEGNLDKILLIMHKKLKTSNPQLKIAAIAKFEHSWIGSEKYYLYWVYLQ